MFRPERIMYQETKMLNNNGALAKAILQDMVAELDKLDQDEVCGPPSDQKVKKTIITTKSVFYLLNRA